MAVGHTSTRAGFAGGGVLPAVLRLRDDRQPGSPGRPACGPSSDHEPQQFLMQDRAPFRGALDAHASSISTVRYSRASHPKVGHDQRIDVLPCRRRSGRGTGANGPTDRSVARACESEARMHQPSAVGSGRSEFDGPGARLSQDLPSSMVWTDLRPMGRHHPRQGVIDAGAAAASGDARRSGARRAARPQRSEQRRSGRRALPNPLLQSTDGHTAPGRRAQCKTAIRDPQTGCSCRIRWLITSVTPARIVTPYKASAISIVRFW